MLTSELVVTTRKAGNRLEFDFEDAGPGISTEDMAHVLEPLFSTRSFGTGLGLPTVQSIMEEHDGY